MVCRFYLLDLSVVVAFCSQNVVSSEHSSDNIILFSLKFIVVE